MRDIENMLNSGSELVVEPEIPAKAWHSSGRAVCGGCGSDDIKLDWMIFDIEASSGPRDHTFSVKPTITHGFLLCPKCYTSVPAGILRNAVSDAYAIPAAEHYGCMTLCVKPVKDAVLGVRKKITRRWTKCPACHRVAGVYKIGENETPHTVAEVSRIANPNR